MKQIAGNSARFHSCVDLARFGFLHVAFRKGIALRGAGASFDEMVEALLADAETKEWAEAKGRPNKGRQFHRIWDRAGGDAPSWAANFQTDSRHEPYSSLANVMIALENDPALINMVAFDEMQRMLMHPVPYQGRDEPDDFKARPLADTDVTATAIRLQRSGLPRIGPEVCHAALLRRAHHRAFHPLRDYLTSVRWDGRPRIEKWLSYYPGASIRLTLRRSARCS